MRNVRLYPSYYPSTANADDLPYLLADTTLNVLPHSLDCLETLSSCTDKEDERQVEETGPENDDHKVQDQVLEVSLHTRCR